MVFQNGFSFTFLFLFWKDSYKRLIFLKRHQSTKQSLFGLFFWGTFSAKPPYATARGGHCWADDLDGGPDLGFEALIGRSGRFGVPEEKDL